MTNFRIAALLAGSALAGLPAMAAAQNAADDARTTEIVITGTRLNPLTQPAPTASRLGLTALETPASISTLMGDEIRARGDLTIGDAVARAPGITNIGDPGNGGVAYSARGFSGQGSVLQLVDSVRLFPVAGSITFPVDPWMVDRIDVLSGPASVLYGQGALGGAINVVTKKANRERLTLDAVASYGSQNTQHIAAGIGGPLGEMFAFRADASYRKSDGYVDRGDSNSLALGGTLEFRPSDKLVVALRHDYGDTEPSRYFGTPLINNRLDTSIRHKNYNVRDSIMHFKDNRTTLTLDWSPTDAITVSNVGYRLATKRKWRNLEAYCWVAADGDCPNQYGGGTPGQIWRGDNIGIVHDQEQWGDQGTVKLSTPLGGSIKNDLVVGFDVNQVKLTYSHDFGSDYQEDNVDPHNFDPGLFFDTQGIAPRYRTKLNERSFFAEDRLEITPELSLMAGVRFERDKTGRWTFVYNSAGTQIVGETPALAGGTKAYRTFNNTTWRVGSVYQPTPDISLYAQYSTGVDPLGTLATYSTSASQYAFTNAKGDQVEVGAKASFLDGRGSATLAAYKIVKKGLAAQRGPNQPIEQVGQRSAKGIEAAVSFELAKGFGVDANGTVLDARYDDFISGTTSYKGKTPPMIPETTANLSLRWDATRKAQVRAGLRYVGKRYSDDANTFRVPAYTVVDASLSYAVTANVAVDVRVTNLFDKDYARTTYYDQMFILGRPRSVDVSLRTRF
jgi:iron complex outermembrane receptor protein